MRIHSTKQSGLALAVFAGIAGLVLPNAAHACATCGCSLSTDAAMGYSALPGWRINLDYSYIPQNQLRSGDSAVSPIVPAELNAAGGSQEVEHQTINRYLNLGISYSPSPKWNFSAIVPFIDRSHTTYSNATPDQLTPDYLSGATSEGLGDIKLLANYQGFLPTHNFGIQLGVKLPTGRYGGQNVNTGATVGRNPVFFSSGQNAPGQALDTSLQPGTGSTDVIVGAYYYQPVSQNFDMFANGQFQSAVIENLRGLGQDYRPGNLATVSIGLRYEANPRIVPQIQINVTRKSADQGALADATDTAGTVVYLSPGVTFSVKHNFQVYGFVQKSLYSQLSGYQLFPRWTATVGGSYAF